MIAAAPVVAQGVDQLIRAGAQSTRVAAWFRGVLRAFQDASEDIVETDRHWRLYPLSIGTLLVLGLVLRVPNGNVKLTAEFDPKRYPVKAIEMLLDKNIGERIFTDDEWGDYLIYRTYPQRRVFVDGRSDFYGGPFDEKFIDVLNVKYGWQEYLKQYQVDTVLLSPSSPLAGAMKESNRWRPIYDDTIAIVFRRVAALERPPASGKSSESIGFSVLTTKQAGIAAGSNHQTIRRMTA